MGITSLANLGLAEEQVLIENCPYRFDRVKYYIEQKGVELETCGHTEWMGKPLKSQIHHKNGKTDDNRKENLIRLCPNCHSQTDNYTFHGKEHKPETVRKWVETRSRKKEYYQKAVL